MAGHYGDVAKPVSPAASGGWTARGLLVVITCFVINMLDGMDIVIMSYIAPALAKDWNVPSESLGIMFSAGLLGMAVGCLFIAPLADRLGRRAVIIGALTLMSTGMIASGFVDSLWPLVGCRLFVGAGIGTVLAAMAALVAEFAPEKHRSLAVGTVQAGYPLAAVLTGLLAVRWLPVHGWQTLLLAAGLATLVMLPIGIFTLPESRAFREERRHAAGKPGHADSQLIGALLGPGIRSTTLMLWAAVFCGFMVLYFIVSWIPKLAIDAGLSDTNGIYAGALYNLGAFMGTMLMSALSVRFRLDQLIPAFLAAAICAMLVFGSVAMPVAPTLAVAFLIGVSLQGGFNGIYPLAASIYPAESRATGIGWAIGVGRGGAVIGPLLGGVLMGWQVPLWTLFAIYSVPLFFCGLAAFGAGRAQGRTA